MKYKVYPTKTVTKAQIKAHGISLDTFPSAGPRPNITGMKRMYWGKDALCLKVGTYVYKVTAEVYNLF